MRGFLDAMAKAQLDVPESYIHHVEGGEPMLGQISIDYFTRLSPRPTAIVCFNDMLAIGVLKSCEMAGLKVPEDLSVTGFDNITYSAFTTPCLTTFDQPKFSIGQEAAQLLLDLLQAEDGSIPETPNVKIIKGKLLVRGSTGIPGEV